MTQQKERKEHKEQKQDKPEKAEKVNDPKESKENCVEQKSTATSSNLEAGSHQEVGEEKAKHETSSYVPGHDCI